MMNKLLKILVLCLIFELLSLGFILQAYAQTCVGEGVLQINYIPSGQNFGSMVAGGEPQVFNHAYSGSIEFEDTRNILADFTLSVVATDFQNTIPGKSDKFPVTKLAIKPDDNNTVTYKPECDDAVGITVNYTVLSSFEDGDQDGVSNPKVLVVGDTKKRVGVFYIEPVIRLTLPGSTPVGNYRTTLTYSII